MAEEEEGEDDVQIQSIPHELVIDILTRLPVKTLLQFRSVSTLWKSTISDPSFARSHFSRSVTYRGGATTLLITFANHSKSELFIFSATIPTNQTLVHSNPNPTHHLTISVRSIVETFVSKSLQGLICLSVDGGLRVCNPATRQFIRLPSIELETTCPWGGGLTFAKNAFAFDPATNQHKVLKTFTSNEGGDPEITEHGVFTVGVDNQWRRIASPRHFMAIEHVCVNGIMYYKGLTFPTGMEKPKAVLVAFDVASEVFHFISMPDCLKNPFGDSVLVEYEGRLAALQYRGFQEGNKKLAIWTLETEQKQKWVEQILLSPANWSEIQDAENFYFAGTTLMGEVIFVPPFSKNPFYMFFYDIKRNNLRKVEICGLPEEFRLRDDTVRVSVSHYVESLLSLPDIELGC